MTNKKQNNKGFSLVELIVVIAIMIVLVAVLAPVFTKYVEQARRATDVQNANTIAEAVLVDAADGTISGDKTATVVKGTPSAIQSAPVAKGDAVKKGNSFVFEYTKESNTVKVYIDGCDTLNLTDEGDAAKYKNDTAGTYKAQ